MLRFALAKVCHGVGRRGWWKAGDGVGGGQWEAGAAAARAMAVDDRLSTPTGGVEQCWMEEDRGSGCLGVVVAAMAAAVVMAAGGRNILCFVRRRRAV
jgi:hypothetical protein